jgi:hypothetical protein
VASRPLDVARVFKAVEGARERLGIEDWGVTQTSLEEVFVKITQEAERTGAPVPY